MNVQPVGMEDLTEVEADLVQRVERGEWLDLLDGDGGELVRMQPWGPSLIDEVRMQAWGPSHEIRASVIRDIVLGRLAAHPDPHGLRLRGAHILGPLDLENITSDVDIALDDCLIDGGVVARDADLFGLALMRCRAGQGLDLQRLQTRFLVLRQLIMKEGGVSLAGGHIGRLRCEGVDIHGSSCALSADNLTVDEDASLSGKFITDSRGHDAVRLEGAHIGGQLDCNGATMSSKGRCALRADRLTVDQSAVLPGTFTTDSISGHEAVRLIGARIHGSLNCSGATMSSTSGNALLADGLVVDGDLFAMRGKFESRVAYVAVSRSTSGTKHTVRLIDADIGGQLNCGGATMSSQGGNALLADHLSVAEGAFLTGTFTTESSQHVAARLVNAHIDGALDCTGAVISNTAGAGLLAMGATVDRDLHLVNFQATVGSVAVDLRNVQVGGQLEFDWACLGALRPGLVRVDGMVYRGLPQPRPEEWLTFLEEATEYAAQPYRHLADVYRAMGNDRAATDILIAQRRQQIKNEGALGRVWGWVIGWLLGYGYKPWRAVIGLIITVGVAVGLAFALGGQGGLAEPARAAWASSSAAPSALPAPTPCLWTETAAFGLDVGTPILNLGANQVCNETNTSWGQALTVSGWILHVAAWAFAALFIAGFTSAVRKT